MHANNYPGNKVTCINIIYLLLYYIFYEELICHVVKCLTWIFLNEIGNESSAPPSVSQLRRGKVL